MLCELVPIFLPNYLFIIGDEAAISRSPLSAERDQCSSGEEVYSSGEETISTWTVEKKQVFEEFRNVEIDVSLHRKGILSTESDQQGVISVN